MHYIFPVGDNLHLTSTPTVNYAAALALEVRQPNAGGEPVIRFNFKNGTDEEEFTRYNFLGSTTDVPLTTFVNTLKVCRLFNYLYTAKNNLIDVLLASLLPSTISQHGARRAITTRTEDARCSPRRR